MTAPSTPTAAPFGLAASPAGSQEFQSQFKPRCEGLRWRLLSGALGELDGVEGSATNAMQAVLQYYLPYVLPLQPPDLEQAGHWEHAAVIGTAASNALIAHLIASGHLEAPTGPEGYSIALCESPWRAGARLLAVAGSDPRGVLYGVHEAAARLFCGGTLLDGFAARRQYLEVCPSFSLREKPAIEHRGIWSWGFAIYDYRRFIDNMARLKLNTLTLWNDCAPLNAREVMDYACRKGVRIVFGFHWGWGFAGALDLSRREDHERILKSVLNTYRTQYAGLNHSGIYFQTLTENNTRQLAGRSTAQWCCDLVNRVAGVLLEEYPNLRIYFGLHGTSIGEDYRHLKALDPRVAIVWEDCGSFPFAYGAADTADFSKTLEHAKRLAAFRPGIEMAMVPKGLMCLRWNEDFENHGPFLLGEQSALSIKERALARQNEWDQVNNDWYRNYPLAARFYRELLEVNPRAWVAGLIEDALFEERIQPAAALFAEVLWNPSASDTELLARAMRPYHARF